MSGGECLVIGNVINAHVRERHFINFHNGKGGCIQLMGCSLSNSPHASPVKYKQMETIRHQWEDLYQFIFVKKCKHCGLRKISALKGHFRTRYRRPLESKMIYNAPPCITRKIETNE